MVTSPLAAEKKKKRAAFYKIMRRLFGALFLIFIISTFFYKVGFEQANIREAQMRHEMTELRLDLRATRQQKEQSTAALALLRADLEHAQEASDHLLLRYAEDRPTAALAELFDIAKEKQAEGVSDEHMLDVISTLTPNRSCIDANPNSKRFMLRTALSYAEDDVVTYADGRIEITGNGINARNSDGSIEAWFDPNKTVTINFTLTPYSHQQTTETEENITTESIEGMLPLSHNLIFEGRQYQFQITNSPQTGFVTITAQHCNWP